MNEWKKRTSIHYCANLIIGDIIHLIGYYPMSRPTTTTTYRPPSFDPATNNKPYYHYPQNDHQNEWNYESNHIPHEQTYSTFNTQPLSSSSTSGFYTNNKPSSHNNYNYNNYGSGSVSNGFLDESGYQLTPSPVVSTSNNNDYLYRPKPQRPNRPSNGFDDYDDGYSYGSYQGIVMIEKLTQIQINPPNHHFEHVIMHQSTNMKKIIKKSSTSRSFQCQKLFTSH